MPQNEAVLCHPRRTAVGRFGGSLKDMPATALGATVVEEIIRQTELDPGLVDGVVMGQVVNLLQDLQRDLGVALLFISHDLAVVEHMAHRVAVMYLGRIVELGTRDQLFSAPAHPYTRALLEAVPRLEPGDSGARDIVKGDVPSPIDRPAGCHFHTRCPLAINRCRAEEPALRTDAAGRAVACHLA